MFWDAGSQSVDAKKGVAYLGRPWKDGQNRWANLHKKKRAKLIDSQILWFIFVNVKKCWWLKPACLKKDNRLSNDEGKEYGKNCQTKILELTTK